MSHDVNSEKGTEKENGADLKLLQPIRHYLICNERLEADAVVDFDSVESQRNNNGAHNNREDGYEDVHQRDSTAH